MAAGLDNLLADALKAVIKDNLGEPVYEQVKNRLRDRYGISVLEGIQDFSKIDATLRELYQNGADNIEKQFLNNFVSIDSPSKKNKTWITIHDQSLVNLILASFADPDKRRILDSSAMREPQLIVDIIKSCDLPKSTGYRITKELADRGLLYEQGYSLANDGRKMSRYVPLFDNIKVDIQGEETTVKVQINNDFLKESRIMQCVL